MTQTSNWRDTAIPCYEPTCPGVAEPEQDGSYRYHACVECGYCFNYEAIPTPGTDTCAIGVPEAVRRAADIRPPLLLQIGRRHDDAS